MTQDPRLRPDPSAATPSWSDKQVLPRRVSAFPAPQKELTAVARTLAAHADAVVAFSLALDLVLNDVVEQACSTTGATGAAIALAREGVMECRATTGNAAPDLGVRVESDSGLSGACLRTGEVQDCRDTETDGRVDAEACRQLGVRSMVIIPLAEGRTPFGILEVLSSRPNFFSDRDMQILQGLTQRIVASKREAERGAAGAIGSVEEEPLMFPVTKSQLRNDDDLAGGHPTQNVSKNDLWTTILVILVIATAVVLGVLIGWRGAAKRLHGGLAARIRTDAAPSNVPVRQSDAGPSQPPASLPAEKPKEKLNLPVQLRAAKSPDSADAPAGGLVVTQNGKVIYRALRSTQPGKGAPASGTSQTPGALVTHRVEPEYPADAKSQHIQGPVVLDVQVLADGTVGTIGIISGDPSLAEAAVHAVRQWKYQPNLVNGRPVEGQTRITINFNLPPAN